MNLFIGCASSEEIPSKYLVKCKKYLEGLFEKDNNLVFGAYKSGIMGIAYDIAIANNKDIIGACPKVFQNDLLNINCTKEIVTEDILDRTKVLIDEADALIFFPGGIGTILELMASIDKKRNGEINKPIILYNCCNFFEELFIFLDKIYAENFSSQEVRNCYYISNDVQDTLDYINNYYEDINIKKRKK